MSIVIVFLEIVLLLCCAAFFSGAETAVTAVSRAEYRSLKKSSRKGAQRLARLVEIKDKIVTVALIGTNFVNTLNSGLITAFTLNVFGAQAVPAATAGITVLIIILAEIFQGSRCGTAGIHRESGIASIILVLSAAAAARCGVFAVDARRPETFKRTIA